MEGADKNEQPTDQKVQWAALSDEEEEEQDQQDTKTKQAGKKQQKKKTPGTKTQTKASNNIFVCNDLDVEDDEDEPEQPAKKEKKAEGPSMRDFVGKTNNAEQKPEDTKPLSKKDQKKKELEEFEKALEEFKTTSGTEPAAETGKTEGEVIKVSAEKATEKENIDANEAEKKKKKKKKAKEGKEGEKKEGEDEAKPAEEKKEGEGQVAGPVDVEKRIQEIMKSKAKQQAQPKKTTGPNLEAAKQEILARQQKKTTKKKYEDL